MPVCHCIVDVTTPHFSIDPAVCFAVFSSGSYFFLVTVAGQYIILDIAEGLNYGSAGS